MNIQQLKYVVEISHTGSITQAAKNLYMGQPNLSKSIKELEAEIGITLFARTPKGVVATPEGETFVKYASGIVQSMDSLAAMYQKDAPQTGISLRVSVPRASYVAHSFGAFVGSYSGQTIDVSYRETNAMNVINDVYQNRSSLGIVRYHAGHEEYFANLFSQNSLIAEPLWDYDMLVLMRKNHPLATVSEVKFEQLSQYPEIVHGDFTSVISDIEPERDSDSIIAAARRIAVYDRGSQFDILQSVKGSYLWVSPVPFTVLAEHELVQKPCDMKLPYRDVLVHRAAQTLRGVEQGFADVLKSDVKALKKALDL